MSISEQIASIIHDLHHETKKRKLAESRLESIESMLNATRNSISRQSDFSHDISREFSTGSPRKSTPQHQNATISNFLHLNLLKEVIFNLKYRIERRIQDRYSEVIILEHEHLVEKKQLIDAPTGNQVTILFLSIEHFDQICLFDPSEAFQMMTDTYHNLIQMGLDKHRGYKFWRDEDLYGLAFHSSFEAVQFACWLQKEMLLMNYEVDRDESISDRRIKLLNLPYLRTETNDESEVIFRGFRVKIGICVGDPDYKIDNALHNTVNWGDSWAGNIWHEMDPKTLKFRYYGSVVDQAESVMNVARGGETLVTKQVWKNIKKLVYSRGFEDNVWMTHIDLVFASERETNMLHENSDDDSALEEEDHDTNLYIEKHLEEEYSFLHGTDLRRVLPDFLKKRTFTKPVLRIPVELQYERLINQYLQLNLDIKSKQEIDQPKPNIFRPTEFNDRILLTPLDILTQANVQFNEDDAIMEGLLPRTALITPELLLSNQKGLKIVGSDRESRMQGGSFRQYSDPDPHSDTADNEELSAIRVLEEESSILNDTAEPQLAESQQLQQLQDANAFLRFQLSQKTREVDDLENEVLLFKQIHSVDQNENAKLREEMTVLNERLGETQTIAHTREQKLAQISAEINEKDRIIHNLQEQLNEMHAIKERERQLLHTVKQQHQDIQSLNAENKKLLARLRVDEILMKPDSSRDHVQQYFFSPSSSPGTPRSGIR